MIAGSGIKVAKARPPMNRAEGTGSPSALTLISVSRASSSAIFLAPIAMITTQVPVETTEKRRWARQDMG